MNLLEDPTLVGLRVGAVTEGWDAVENWLLVRGQIDLPGIPRVSTLHPEREKADGLIRDALATFDTFAPWQPIELPPPITNGTPPEGVTARIHPLGERFGVSEVLVAIADAVCGPGDWRYGYAPPTWPREAEAAIVGKVKDGDLVAILAPARRLS